MLPNTIVPQPVPHHTTTGALRRGWSAPADSVAAINRAADGITLSGAGWNSVTVLVTSPKAAFRRRRRVPAADGRGHPVPAPQRPRPGDWP